MPQSATEWALSSISNQQDYLTAMADRLEFPSFPTMIAALAHRGRADAEKRAFIIDGNEISYGRLWEDVRWTASRLSAAGLGANDRIALVLPTGLDFVRLLFAAQLLRAVPLAINRQLPASLIARRLDNFAVAIVICNDDIVDSLDKACAERGSPIRPKTVETLPPADDDLTVIDPLPGPRDIAYIQATSGTTGEPKGAAVAHQSLIACLKAHFDGMHAYANDVFVTWVPLHHDYGLVSFVFLPLYLGSPSHLLEPSIANFSRWLETISEVGGTVTGAPDFGFRIAARMVDPARVDLRTLRMAADGGEPARRSTIEDFECRYGIPGVVRPGYGLAETTLSVAVAAPGEPLCVDAAGTVSCGRPLPGVEIRIVDENGGKLSAGEQGDIEVRAEQVFDGYIDDEAATAEVLSADGWLKTGDVGYQNDDGYLFVLGRKRAMIKHAGAAIAPGEIEEAVDLLDGIRLSAVIGVADDTTYGSENPVVVAELRTAGGHTADKLAALCRAVSTQVEETIGFVPHDVLLVAPRTIHRTDNGKIRHWRLKEAVVCGELEDAGKVLCRYADTFTA